jgi:hypothetical protein
LDRPITLAIRSRSDGWFLSRRVGAVKLAQRVVQKPDRIPLRVALSPLGA